MRDILLLGLPGTSLFAGSVQRRSFLEVLRNSHLRTADFETIPIENLRMAYQSSYLDAVGLGHIVLDACIEEMSMADVVSLVRHIRPLLICLPHSRYIVPAQQYYADLREFTESLDVDWDCHITLEGYFPSLHSRAVLRRFPIINSIISGNGEVALPELANAVKHQQSLSAVSGLVRREDGKIVTNPECVDTRPFEFRLLPNRSHVPTVRRKGFACVVRSSYGCPFRCNYCLFGAFFSKYRRRDGRQFRRTPVAVCEEIQGLVVEHGVERISFADEVFWDGTDVDRQWITEFCSQLKKKHLNVSFSVDLRIEQCDRSVVTKLAEVGLGSVFVGIETVSPTALRQYGRRSAEESIDGVLGMCGDCGVRLLPGMMLYDHTTTLDELERNLHVMHKFSYYSLYRYTSRLTVFGGLELARGFGECDQPIIDWCFRDVRVEQVYRESAWYFGEAFDVYRQLRKAFSPTIPNEIVSRCIDAHRRFVLGSVENAMTDAGQQQRENRKRALKALARVGHFLEGDRRRHIRSTAQ